ncbi:hypothetical protein MTR67_047856 [Solanum verrucosum]|uniref:Uncharacterized protein n=1 Tax=Solanum verrucosum TaxID=315347 RepID=A0AAF0V058_SOLVR|nr:hypothetical protein MTR67_047856 [Solanum verrucosum]
MNDDLAYDLLFHRWTVLVNHRSNFWDLKCDRLTYCWALRLSTDKSSISIMAPNKAHTYQRKYKSNSVALSPQQLIDELSGSEFDRDMTRDSLRVIPFNLSEATECRFIYGPSRVQSINTAEYDYRGNTGWSHDMTLPIKKDSVVMIASLMAGNEINFYQIMIVKINERAFWDKTTLPFPCLIFHLCRKATITVWGCDRLIEVTKMVYVGWIRDETNPAAP